jgi:hypothetical protein
MPLLLAGRPITKLLSRQSGAAVRVHAVCGALVAAHIARRGLTWARTRTCGFDGSWATLAWLVPHACLVVSSFAFHLPAVRNPRAPMLWPEGRRLTAIFSTRSLAVLALGWASLRCERDAPVLRDALLAARGGCVLGACVAADAAGGKGGGTIRGMPWPAGWPRWLVRTLSVWYSFSQLLATCMFTSYRLDSAFTVLAVIQAAAFLMTLCRKGLLSCAGWHRCYAAALGAVFVQHLAAAPVLVHGESRPRTSELLLLLLPITLFAVLRFCCNANKYVLWSAMVAAHAAAARFGGVLDRVVVP